MGGVIGNTGSFCKNGLINWTQSIIVGAGADALWVGVAVNRWSAGTREIVSMTYDGSSVTKDGQANLGAEDMHWQWWYIFNPSDGANNLVATHSGTGDIAHSVHYASLWSIDTAIAPRIPIANASGAATSRSATVVTEVGDLVMAIGGTKYDRTIVPHADTTEIGELYCSYDVQLVDGWSGYRTAATTSTLVGMTFASDKCGICANAFATLKAGNQAIWVMSKIWDRIQENRKKLGVGDLDGFRQDRDGLFKPQPDLVTI